MLIHTNILTFHDFNNGIGHLVPIEAEKDIPFQIRRVYYITQVPAGAERGFHSHRALKQVLICLHGSVKVRVKTPFDEEIIELNDPSKGLFIGYMIWREMFDFSDDAVLMVLASEHYTESDYIRDYQQYLEEANEYFQLLQCKE